MGFTTLDQLESGQTAVIKTIKLADAQAVRLMEMGLLEGLSVTMIRKAPLGDPVEYRVGQTSLSLRKAEAAQVEVEL